MAQLELRNTVLNNNEWVNCDCLGIQPSWQKRTNHNPVDGEADTTAGTWRLAKSDRVGVENPAFTFTVIVDMKDFQSNDQLWAKQPRLVIHNSPKDGLLMTGRLTLGFLHQLVYAVQGQTYLRVTFGETYKWMKTTYTDGVTTGDDEIPIEILSVSPVPDSSLEESHQVVVQITAREVRV